MIELPYQWKQTLHDVDVTIPLPKGTKARELIVVFKKKHISAGFKGKEPILEGELCKEIKLEDSTWLIDNGELLIHLGLFTK